MTGCHAAGSLSVSVAVWRHPKLVRHPGRHHGADGGLRPGDAPALARGESIFNHDGPLGSTRSCSWTRTFAGHPAGHRRVRSADPGPGRPRSTTMSSHTYYPGDVAARGDDSRRRRGAGWPDPAGVKVWSCFATIGDHLPEELRLKKTVARLATYLQGLRRSAGQHQQLGSGCAATVQG